MSTEATTAKLDENYMSVGGTKYSEYKRTKEWLEQKIESSKKQPSAEIITLSPLIAQLLLARNANNRPISIRNAADLASDIANKRWEFNGESIVVSREGHLMDGQHRCLQVVTTGVSIQTVIVFGPKEDTRFTIDTGKSKTIGNFLAMKGYKYTHALGPALSYLLQWKKNNFINFGGANPNMPTTAEKLECVEEERFMRSSCEFTADCMKTTRSHAVLTFCHYVFWKRSSREAADNFILKLIHGDDLKRGDPILYARNRLPAMSRGVSANSRIELLFKCWNAHRLGQKVDHYKLSGGKLPKLER